jgi:predicted nucleic acid-binding protein
VTSSDTPFAEASRLSPAPDAGDLLSTASGPRPGDAVVLDTDVFSVLFIKSASGRLPAGMAQQVQQWRDQLAGRLVVIATQTRAELLAWPLDRGWGEDRTRVLRTILDATPTIPVTENVIEAFARLSAACRASGHPLAQRAHTGDRWVAATAIAIGAPVLARDGIYRAAPHVELLGEWVEPSD